MIAPSLPATGPAPAANAPAPQEAAAGDESRGGFAELMGGEAKPAPASSDKQASGAERPERSEHSKPENERDSARSDASLAERLLALIGASAVPANAATPTPGPLPGQAPPPSLTPPPPRSAPGALIHGATTAAATPGDPGATAAAAAATALPLDAALPGQNAATPATAATTPGAFALPVPAAVPTAPTAHAATPAATGAMATDAALAELAQALAPAGRETVREAGTRESTDLAGIGDRGPLLASGPASTARPVTAPSAAQALAMPAHPEAGFDDSFGARIGWMAEQRIGRAELRLNPEQMGTIDVRLQMDGTRVSAEFQSPHAEVRQALEQSVGRLRDMLGQHGMQLAQANVGHGGGGHDGRPAPSPRADGATVTDDGFVEMPAAAAQIRSRGLLDEYA